jgi:deoxyribonuclease IV
MTDTARPNAPDGTSDAAAAPAAPGTQVVPVALPGGRTLGAHLPMADGMVRAVDRIADVGGGSLQVFTDNPTSWRRRAEPPAEQAAFRARLAERSIGPIAIHAPYLVNLAGPEEDLYARSVTLLASELAVAPGFDARFVNIHIGSHRGAGREVGIERLADGIRLALAEAPVGPGTPIVALENSAGGGFAVGTTVEDLAEIADALEERGIGPDRVGFCLDTAHLFGWGYALDEPEGVDDLLARVEAVLGPGRVVMVHLNDSKAERGSRYDRHEHLGVGRIGPAGLHRFLTHPFLAGVPHYLETPGMDEGYDAMNVRNALLIAAGMPIEPVPPEARKARGSGGLSAPD